MNKKSKKSNLLRNLLTTVSFASVMVGGSNAAFGVSTVSNRDNAGLATARHWNQAAAHVAPAMGADNTIFLGDAHNLAFNAAIGNLGTLNILGHDGLTTIVTENNQLTNVISNFSPVELDKAKIANDGVDVVHGNAANAKHNFNIDAAITMEFGNAGAGDLSALGNVILSNAGATMRISLDKYNMTGNITTTVAGGGGIIQVNATDVSFSGVIGADAARIATLTIGANKSAILKHHAFIINTAIGAGATLTVGDKINITGTDISGANANVGTLIFEGDSIVTSDLGHINALDSITIKDGTVDVTAANAAIKSASIILDGNNSVFKVNKNIVTNGITTTNGNTGTLQLHGNFAHNVTVPVGTKDKPLKELKFSGGAAVGAGGTHARTVTTQAYVNNISADGGPITFMEEVNVDTTTLTGIPTELTLTKGGNLGTVDFSNVKSKIIVAAGKNLSGNFYGDRDPKKKHAGSAGTLSFLAGNSEFDGTVTKLDLIEHAGGGTLKFLNKGPNVVTEVKGANGSTFNFVDDYQLTGAINTVDILNFAGNAKIAGNITNVGEINLLKGKTLTVGGNLGVTRKIFFGNEQDKGGTLAFDSKDNVTFTIPAIGELFGGTIDTTKMKDGKALTIDGDIGTNPTADNSKSLDKILLSGQNLNLQPVGHVNIAVMDFNEKPSIVALKTAGVNYALGELKKANKAKIAISENVSLRNTKTTGDEKLEEISFTADKILTLDDGIDIASTSIKAKTNGQGQLVFAKSGTLKGNIGESSKKLQKLQVNDGVEALHLVKPTSQVMYPWEIILY